MVPEIQVVQPATREFPDQPRKKRTLRRCAYVEMRHLAHRYQVGQKSDQQLERLAAKVTGASQERGRAVVHCDNLALPAQAASK